jgi:hypothetical protein
MAGATVIDRLLGGGVVMPIGSRNQPLHEQVRIGGPVEPVRETEAYWATRPRASRLGALASGR